MGKTQSKAENTGTIVNELRIQPATVENTDLLICIYIITFAIIVKFFYKVYKIYHSSLKKKYTNSTISLYNKQKRAYRLSV